MGFVFDPEFWKTLGIIVTPIIGIVGSIVLVIKSVAKNNLTIMQEKHFSAVKESEGRISLIQKDIEIKLNENEAKMSNIKQEIKHDNEKYNIIVEDYFKKSMDAFEKTTTNLLDSVNRVSDKVEIIHSEVKLIKNELDEIKMSQSNKLEFRKKLNLARDEALKYYSEDNELDGAMRRFVNIKCDKFIEFALEIRSYDFNSDEDGSLFEMIVEKGKSIALEIKYQGYEILGKEFVNVFYDLHDTATQIYFDDIHNLLKNEMNRTKHAFQISTENFMDKFLRILFKCYRMNIHMIVLNSHKEETIH